MMKTSHSTWFAALALSPLICLSADAQWIRWDPVVGGNGHWYKAVPNTQSITPRLATHLARQDGGYLATIGSAEENAFVFSLVNSSAFFTTVNGAGPVLGGRQQEGAPEPAGGWYWVTGEPWDYTNWSPESPNNDAPGGEDTLQFYSGVSGTPAPVWNDLHFDNSNCGGYVVERDEDTSRPWLELRVSQVELCWQTATNTWYQVQYRSVLTTNQWVPLSTNWMAGDGTRYCTTDAVVGGSPRRFYQVAATNSPPQ